MKKIVGLHIVRYIVLGTNIKTKCRFITIYDDEQQKKSYWFENDYSHIIKELKKDEGNTFYKNFVSGMYGKVLEIKKVI